MEKHNSLERCCTIKRSICTSVSYRRIHTFPSPLIFPYVIVYEILEIYRCIFIFIADLWMSNFRNSVIFTMSWEIPSRIVRLCVRTVSCSWRIPFCRCVCSLICTLHICLTYFKCVFLINFVQDISIFLVRIIEKLNIFSSPNSSLWVFSRYSYIVHNIIVNGLGVSRNVVGWCLLDCGHFAFGDNCTFSVFLIANTFWTL